MSAYIYHDVIVFDWLTWRHLPILAVLGFGAYWLWWYVTYVMAVFATYAGIAMPLAAGAPRGYSKDAEKYQLRMWATGAKMAAIVLAFGVLVTALR